MKRRRFGRFGIGTGTKVQQANLRALAKEMADDPGFLVPECNGRCSGCPVAKLHSKLKKIQGYRENSVALKKLASGGGHLERSYAAMLVLASEDTPIMFATAKLPTGDVSYTVRGKAKKEYLIGLQHFEDPRLRLLAYSEVGLKKRLHLYSFDDGLSCSGKKPNYPTELISEVLKSSSYVLGKTPRGYSCGHAGHGCGMTLEVLSAGVSLEICKSCTSAKANLFTELASRVLSRNPEDDFRITLNHDIECTKGGGCTLSRSAVSTKDLLAEYRSGRLSDRGLVDAYEKKVRESVERSSNAIFVLGNSCYEGDYEAFIKALKPTDIEEAALKRVLKSAAKPVVMGSATPNAVLALFWEEHGANAIHAVIGDKDMARKIYSDSRGSGKTPVQILREAQIEKRSKTALSALPELNKLGRIGKYADGLARAYRGLGKEEAIKRIGTIQDDTKVKSINCGFLLAFGVLKGKEWQFSREELDYGGYLADFVKRLLESPPEGYAEALQNLLTASGLNETVG